jgi:hypothetical protein
MPTGLHLLAFGLVASLQACPAKNDAAPASSSVACSAPDQFRCRELPQPSVTQREGVTVECGSGSGKLSSPASCPTAGFVGKCTIAASGKDGPEVRRWYKADDAPYQQDFCVNTAKGVWSTAF